MGIISTIGKVCKQAGKVIVKHSPQILLAGGVAASVGAVVLTAKEAPKLNGIMKEHSKAIDNKKKEKGWGVNYITQDEKNEITLNTTKKVCKLFAPIALLESVSISCFLACYGILKARIAAVCAVAKATEMSFRRYRNNVIEAEGKEKDQEYMFGSKFKTVKKQIVDPETGKKKTVEMKVIDGDKSKAPANPYVRLFNARTSRYWESNGFDYNLGFLQTQQEMLNIKLREEGFVPFNDALDACGLKKDTELGLAAGWKYYPDGNNPKGDNYIDIGIYRMNNTDDCDNSDILLTFNCDGLILGKDDNIKTDTMIEEETLSSWIDKQNYLLNVKEGA